MKTWATILLLAISFTGHSQIFKSDSITRGFFITTLWTSPYSVSDYGGSKNFFEGLSTRSTPGLLLGYEMKFQEAYYFRLQVARNKFDFNIDRRVQSNGLSYSQDPYFSREFTNFSWNLCGGYSYSVKSAKGVNINLHVGIGANGIRNADFELYSSNSNLEVVIIENIDKWWLNSSIVVIGNVELEYQLPSQSSSVLSFIGGANYQTGAYEWELSGIVMNNETNSVYQIKEEFEITADMFNFYVGFKANW